MMPISCQRNQKRKIAVPQSVKKAMTAPPQALPLRSPNEVMKLARLGAFFPHRLSFMRILIRRLASEKAIMHVAAHQLDANGIGHMVLQIAVGGRPYSLIGYSCALLPEERTDRVIATKWDASFCLFDGIPNAADITYLGNQVVRQESGRYDDRVLTLSRANKSVRLFGHVIKALAEGIQPKLDKLIATGYLMRTTAVYGNGKFGIADHHKIASIESLAGPFQAELLTVFLIREFTFLLVEWLAKKSNPKAVALCPAYRRYLGIGNSTGLGMAPFLVTHPCLIHSWISARETALARVRALSAMPIQRRRLLDLLDQAQCHIAEWRVSDSIQEQRIATLSDELAYFKVDLWKQPLAAHQAFDDAFGRTAKMSIETQELLVSLLIEIAPEVVDELADGMANPQLPKLDLTMRLGTLRALIEAHYSWACGIELSLQSEQAQFWYVSAEKLEPRVGLRYEEPGAVLEMPFHIPRYVQQLNQADAHHAVPRRTYGH